MVSPLESLIQTGTKLWLDSVDPEAVAENRALGATGATSNPVIISDLISTGRFDDELSRLIAQGLANEDIAWNITDDLVSARNACLLRCSNRPAATTGMSASSWTL